MPRGRGGRKTYNRNGNGGRQYYKRRTNFTYGDVVDKVVMDVARLKGMINVEFKTKDLSLDAAPTTAIPFIALLNGLQIGDDFNNRDGRSVRWKSIRVKINIFINQITITTVSRCMIIIDKQPNGTLMLIGDLLGHLQSQLDVRNLSNRKRFVSLFDQRYATSITGNQVNLIDFYKKIDMITVYNEQNTGTITDIETNALYLVVLSNKAGAPPVVSIETRCRFIDN